MGKKTKFGVFDGKVTMHIWQNAQYKSMVNTLSIHMCKKCRSLDFNLLCYIDSDWTTLSIGERKLGSFE